MANPITLLHLGWGEKKDPWSLAAQTLPASVQWQHLDFTQLVTPAAASIDGLQVSTILIDLAALQQSSLLDEWSLKAWKESFQNLLSQWIQTDGRIPLLMGYAPEARWEWAQLALKLGVRELCLESEIIARLSEGPLSALQPSAPALSAPVEIKKYRSSPASHSTAAPMLQKIPKHAIPFPIPGLEGDSSPIEGIRNLIRKSAPTLTSVLIAGSTGTGKERVALALHQHSERARGPWVILNCAALSAGLIESELFGHVSGSFTGAERDHLGILRSAQGGTIFLDEVAALPLEAQSKLLRAIQEKQMSPVGSSEVIHLDIRWIASTSRDLDREVAEGRFREDFLYRLRVIDIRLPSLAERKSDLPILSQSVLKKLAKLNRRPPLELSEHALEKMLFYAWPGNIRELENTLELAATLTWAENRTLIEVGDLSHNVQWATMQAPQQDLKEAVRRFEREYIQQALKRLGGSKEAAAESLGVSLASLYRKLGHG